MASEGSSMISLETEGSRYTQFGGPVSFVGHYLKVKPGDVADRIVASLGPPCGNRFKRTKPDLVGPIFALLLLTAIVHYGYSKKDSTATDTLVSPIKSVLVYALFMPSLGFVLCKLGRSTIPFWDLVALLGYALYSHILTLSVSLLIYQEESNTFFFMCLFLFGGLSALRMCIILISGIPKPAARLLVCSALFILHLLYLIFLHFSYMHPTFVYGIGSSKRVPTVIHTNL